MQNICQNSKQGKPRSDCFFRLLLQKQSDQALHCLSRPFLQAASIQNFRIFTLMFLYRIHNGEQIICNL